MSLWSANQEFSNLVINTKAPSSKPILKKANTLFQGYQQRSEDVLKQRIYQKELQSLQQQVNTNRIFLDMVVHDMRNPTSSIEFGLQETLKILDTHFENYNNLKKTFM